MLSVTIRQIRLHLDIAAQEFIKINPAVYLESQVHTMTVYRHDMIKLFTEWLATRGEGEVQVCMCGVC